MRRCFAALKGTHVFRDEQVAKPVGGFGFAWRFVVAALFDRTFEVMNEDEAGGTIL